MEKSDKITPLQNYRRRFAWLNIGTILFGAIFLYMLISVIIYLTAKHTAYLEVVRGSISGNSRYTALALKNEQLIPADYSGYVTYYAREGARVSNNSVVCSIDENSSARTVINEELTARDLERIRDDAFGFSLNYSGSTFQSTYDLKEELSNILLDSAQQGSTPAKGLVNLSDAPSSGFVVYKKDEMETLEESEISDRHFNRSKYRQSNLRKQGEKIKRGESLYKLITGETWYLYVPLTDQMKIRLQDRESVRFRFLKDDTTFSAAFSIVENENGSYGKITLKNSLVRYTTDRYLEIELLMDSKKGLMSPSYAITERVFYRIPEEYVIPNPDNSNEITFLRESYRSNGEAVVSYISAPVYAKQDGGYLVDTDLFNEGDFIQMSGTTKKHKIVEENLFTIQGVYNINQGYAQFRQVTVIDSNEEFCIVEPFNVYGLAAHDYIVQNASEVTADEIINV